MTPSLFQVALTLFLVTNPIGNSPAILALVKDFDFNRQRRILLRESLFAFSIALFFMLVGERFLEIIGVRDYSLSITGGVMLLLVGIHMIFPGKEDENSGAMPVEPFFVPIATPLLAGPGVMSMIMLYAGMIDNYFKMGFVLVMAFLGVAAVMATAPYLLRAFGKRGLLALSQFMGMVLIMIAVEMIVSGISLYLKLFSITVTH